MQTSTKATSIASALPTGDLLTAGAINNAAYKIREEFRKLDPPVPFPVPFIAWQHGIEGEDVDRLQNLMASNGAKRDVDLLEKAAKTLKSMSKGVLKQAA